MIFYKWKVKLLKILPLNIRWRYWQVRRGKHIGNYEHIPTYIRQHVPGHSFVDIGCMWGVNGDYTFLAEEVGATLVKGVDVFGPTPEFEEKRKARHSNVEFILGDASHPDTIARVGQMDIVFCAGVLYHHPSPFDLLVALRRMCKKMLILRTATIPEVEGLPNAAVYFPFLDEKSRQLWNLSTLGNPKQVGITNGFEPDQGYGNWFWGLTPSCLRSLLNTAGFRVDFEAPEPFAHTVFCTPIDPPLAHRLPDEITAKTMGQDISEAKIARPA